MMTTATDPRDVLNESPMTTPQIAVVVLTIILNALDGFDVLSISFAADGISRSLGLTQAQLGVVLSMELLGMAVGSVLLGGVADKVGRRPTIMGCLMVMAVGMFMVTTTSNMLDLSFWRVITGLGIGGMLAATTAVVAEFANDRRRHLCVSLMAIGYPLGGVFGGMFAGLLLTHYTWHAVFYFGAIATAVLLPFIYFFMPESAHWLTRKQPVNALHKVNHTLRKMKHATVAILPEQSEETRKRSAGDLFAPGLIAVTIILTLAYFLHVTTFYFILKWTPKIVADMGFEAALAGGVLVWANVGGALGGAVFGLLTTKIELKKLSIAILLLTGVFVAIFGRTPEDLSTMKLLAAMAGFFGNAGIVGLYAIFAQAFPTHVRAAGVGLAIGVGRGGAVLSPILAGILLQAGAGLPTVGLVMGAGSVLAAIALIFLKLNKTPPKGTPVTDEDLGGKVEPVAA